MVGCYITDAYNKVRNERSMTELHTRESCSIVNSYYDFMSSFSHIENVQPGSECSGHDGVDQNSVRTVNIKFECTIFL
jgi:hypothetical protein